MNARQGRRVHRGPAPRLEGLEDRCLLAVSFLQNGDVLTITGDNRPNVVSIQDDGSSGAQNIQAKGDGAPFMSSLHVREIDINTLGGNDTITYNLPILGNGSPRNINVSSGAGNDKVVISAGPLGSILGLNVDLGAGNDNFQATFNGFAAELTAKVLGGAGNDTISFSHTGVVEGTDNLSIDGGTGNDTISLTNQGTVYGTLDATLLGSAGNDRITTNVFSNTNNFSAFPQIGLLVDGGAGNDVINTTYTGTLDHDALLAISTKGGAGNDQITVNDLGNAVQSQVILGVDGGAGNDTILVNSQGDLTGLGFVQIRGGAGNDRVTLKQTGMIDANSAVFWRVYGDGGPGVPGGGNDTINVSYTGLVQGPALAGQHSIDLLVDGQGGQDTVAVLLSMDSSSSGSGIGFVHGGAGNDVLTFAIRTNGAHLTGEAHIIGDAGFDRCYHTTIVQGDPSNEIDKIIT